MKGIVLAGGSGTRLYLSLGDSSTCRYTTTHDLLPPLGADACRDPISHNRDPEDQGAIRLLRDGTQFGINLTYAVQPSPTDCRPSSS